MNLELIRDLKGYLGYNVKCELTIIPSFDLISKTEITTLEDAFGWLLDGEDVIVKPFLKSPNDLTDDELKNIADMNGFPHINKENSIKYIAHHWIEGWITMKTLYYFYENHIDFRNLIKSGDTLRK